MVLTEQQKQDVRQWLAEGASLSDVQKRLREEHQVAMTYMDVRLMVLELGAAVKDKPEPKPVAPAPADAAGDADEPLPDGEMESAADAPAASPAVPLGNVAKIAGGSRHGSASPRRAASIAAHTRSGVHGMSMWRTPRCDTASITAFWIAGVDPIVAASPMPLAPSGFSGDGVSVDRTSKLGISAADGTA